MEAKTISGQGRVNNLLSDIIDGPATIEAHNETYVDNQQALDCKKILSYKISFPETNRQQVGGKGACLAMMDKLGMPVPKSSNITTTLVAEFEKHPIEVSALKQFFSSRFNKNTKELNEFFAYLERSNTRGCNLISTLATIKSFFKEDSMQQKLYISAIEEFIKDEQFYNIVKDLPAANKIRAKYDDLINKLPTNSPIIVRSSGVKEDSFGDAQAGKFESIIHHNTDIITTCLAVLASKYQPAVCQSTEPQGMALTLHHYIDCTAGGVVMSANSLTEHNIKIEFGPNHKELISGTLGKTPHRIIYHRNNQDNKAADPVYDLIKTENLAYTEIQPEALKQLMQYTSRLEDIFNAPVDIEFGIAKNGQLYLFQVRPVTKLSGAMNFATTSPNNPIINGRLISEGICSGKMVHLNQQQDAMDIPQGAIIVAKAYQEWMFEPDFLNKVGGFIFEQGGDNDHVAITLRQVDKPYMVAGEQFKSLKGTNHQDMTLVCGSFNGTEGAYVVAGNELYQELSSFATVANTFAKCSSPTNKTKIETSFDRPDTGFEYLHQLNYRLLEYFSANSWLSNCFSTKGCKALTIEKNRAEIIKQAKAEMNQMFADLDLFIAAYERFLNLGMKGDTKEIKAKLAEANKLHANAQIIKMQINQKITSVEAKLTTDGNLNASVGSYEQYLQDCKDISTMTQSLTVSKSADQAASIQDIIVKIHAGFIDIFSTVAINSGLGDIGILNRETNSKLINFATDREQKIAVQNSISAIKPLSSMYETKMIATNKTNMVAVKLGVHACSIEMLEEAEGGKGRLLRLKFSDDFSGEKNYYIGKLKRFWFLSQLLHHLNIDKESAGMQISVCEATGILTVEFPQIKTKEAMQLGFKKLVEAVAYMRDLDIDLEKLQLNQSNQLWTFSLLQEKLRTLSSQENQDELFCIVFMLSFFESLRLRDLHKLTDETIQTFLTKTSQIKKIETITDLESKCRDIPEIKEKILPYLILNSPTRYVHLLRNSKYVWWLTDKSKVIELVTKSKPLFEIIASEWGNDKDVVLAAVKNHGIALQYASDELKNDRDIILAAVQNNGCALEYADKKFQDDNAIILEAVKNTGNALQYASYRLKNDREIVLEVVKSSRGAALPYASDLLKNDREIVLEAVKNNGYALEYASNRLKNDREIVLEAVKNNGLALEYASDRLKNDREIVLEAVKNNGYALLYANYKFKDDKEIVLVAICNSRSAREYMSSKFNNDRDIILALMKYQQYIDIKMYFNECPTTLQNDVTFIIEVLKINMQILDCIPYSLSQDQRIIDYVEKSSVEFILKVDDPVEETEPNITLAPSLNTGNINIEASTDKPVV